MLTVLQGDALTMLRTLPAESVQCCVTSPPYWGLRDYGTAAWKGGDLACNHKFSVSSPYNENFNERWGNASGAKKQESERHEVAYRDICGKCGAHRIDSQLGLEPTPEEYVQRMVEVFREVRRVLRKDGTLWLNLGDSYAGGGRGWESCDPNGKQLTNRGTIGVGPTPVPHGLKPKDLCGIPWRVAFALQNDGWYLRSDIIWAKPNPMPESVTDRPTKAHEYVFLLTKSAQYFYDAEAIREPADTRIVQKPAGWNQANGRHDTIAGRYESDGTTAEISGRNKRSVWSIPTSPYPDAHFATYPPGLIKPMIMAGTRIDDMILDPFAGSGTSGQVAIELGRKATLIELNPAYVKLIEQRCSTTIGLPLA